VRCRPGTVTTTELATVPDQRCTASRCTASGARRRSDFMSPNLGALLYLVAGVLFILALRGLSSPDSSRRGNLFGMIGMTIAVLTTLGSHPPASTVAW